jgi:hypothetical protein
MIDPKYYGLVEMGFTGAVVLGLAFWQLWSVRDAGKGKSTKDAGAKDPGVSERDHETDKG